MAREHLHLIGIGGTGMTALAGLLHESGCRVTGSDRRLYPPTSTILQSMGLEVREGFAPGNLDPAPDLVVVGNAISRGNPEVEDLLDRDLPYTSMPRLIGERFLRGRHPVVVCGTHGKTTTTSMLAWVLDSAGLAPGFLIGGAPVNFERPYRIGGGAPFVIEGDEYDTAFFDKGPKFMHYRPRTALLGTVEFDHADIYRDLEHVKTVFRRLVHLVPPSGLVVRHEDSPVAREVSEPAFSRVEGYGLKSGAWRAFDLRPDDPGMRFRVLRDGESWGEVALAVDGEYNVRNALAVIAAAADLGLDASTIAHGLASFRGVRRRLELRGQRAGVRVFDDFAHHPTAIRETVRAVRRRFPDRRVWAVIEPRSWSMRRNVFQDRLPEALSDADEVLIASVYGAEALGSGERLDPAAVVDRLAVLGRRARFLRNAAAIVDVVAAEASEGDIVVVMSNGGFDGIHDRLLRALSERPASAGSRRR